MWSDEVGSDGVHADLLKQYEAYQAEFGGSRQRPTARICGKNVG